MKFYKLDDQIVISDKALSVGTELTANTTDGAHEKHVPVIEQDGDTVTVKVGSMEHPSFSSYRCISAINLEYPSEVVRYSSWRITSPSSVNALTVNCVLCRSTPTHILLVFSVLLIFLPP